MAAPTSRRLWIKIFAALNDSATPALLTFDEAAATTGNAQNIITREYAASAANQALDLSAFIDTASWIIILDKGGTGINVNTVSGGTPLKIAASKCLVLGNGTSPPPTLYFTNPSATLAAFIEVVVLGSVA